MYQALILDMDDTLLQQDKTISHTTLDALIKLQRQGILVVLASGRATYGMLLEAKSLQLDKFNSYLIAYNGAKIVQANNQQTIYQQALSPQDIADIQQFAHAQQVGLITAKRQYIYIENYNHYADAEYTVNNMEVVKVNNILDIASHHLPKIILFDSTDKMIEVFNKAQQQFGDKYSITRSNENYVEFMPRNISKGTTLQHLSRVVNIPLKNMVACGDSFNDITMIQNVGMGVAMGNAVEDLKAVAQDITDTNQQDGIVKVINKYFNKI